MWPDWCGGGLGVLTQDFAVVTADGLPNVLHASVAHLDGVPVDDGVEEVGHQSNELLS